MDQVDPLFAGGNVAEDVHAVLNLGVADQGQELMYFFDDGVEIVVAEIGFDLILQLTGLDGVHDLVLELMRLRMICVADLLILLHQLVELFKILVQSARKIHRLHVIHDGRQRSALGDGALWRIVGIIDVEIRHRADADVREAAVGKSGSLAGQEFQIAVGTHMNDHVCLIDALKIAVGGKILMRRRTMGIVENLADRSVAAGARTAALGLHAHESIAVAHAGNADRILVDHGGRHTVDFFADGFAPCVGHVLPGLFGQLHEPRQVFLLRQAIENTALFHDFADGCPSEIGNGLAVHDGGDQFLAASGNIRKRISCGFHGFQNSGDAFQRVQLRTSADGGFHRRTGIVVENEHHFFLTIGFAAKIHPLQHAVHQLLAAAFHGHAHVEFVFLAGAADENRLDIALKLRQRDAPRHVLDGAVRVFLPFVHGHVDGADGLEHRTAEPFQKTAVVRPVSAADEEAGHLDQTVQDGIAVFIKAELFKRIGGALCAQSRLGPGIGVHGQHAVSRLLDQRDDLVFAGHIAVDPVGAGGQHTYQTLFTLGMTGEIIFRTGVGNFRVVRMERCFPRRLPRRVIGNIGITGAERAVARQIDHVLHAAVGVILVTVSRDLQHPGVGDVAQRIGADIGNGRGFVLHIVFDFRPDAVAGGAVEQEEICAVQIPAQLIEILGSFAQRASGIDDQFNLRSNLRNGCPHASGCGVPQHGYNFLHSTASP